MGLDGVELVLAVEHEFQIIITDEEAVRVTTPAKLTDLIYSKLQYAEYADNEICISQNRFYRVRRYLMERFDIPRSKIKPDTPLGSLISINERKQYWQTILLELSEGQTILAPLKRPKQLNLFVLGTPILLIIPLSLYIGFSISVGVAILVMILLVFATNPMRSEFPRQFSTVGDLVKITKTLQQQKWKDKNEVYLRIRKLTAEQLGLNEEEIFPDSHFVKDLGID